MTRVYRPILLDRPASMAAPLAGGWARFTEVEEITRHGRRRIAADAIPSEAFDRLTRPRSDLAGLSWDAPRVMGILNVTPDSFSDGGAFLGRDAAIDQATRMRDEGAEILDIGGESTRPGADFVPAEEEIARTRPVLEALKAVAVPKSIDTRKAPVATAALNAGAAIVNDVSGLTFDADMARVVAESAAPVCIMHAQGDPKTMQADPHYDDVVLDVYDWLEDAVTRAEAAGIPRDRIIVDPGIGFGKTLDHNLALLRDLAVFHGLGCVLLLGASRKRFIGTLTGEDRADARGAGSVGVALIAAQKGAQILRVHDVRDTVHALTMARETL
ncbi:MAG: dihydropteroate synthase [Pseudomonadota bacterium]